MTIGTEPLGEVFVRRQVLRVPFPVNFRLTDFRWLFSEQVFRYPWALQEAKEAAWPSYQAKGWSEYPEMDDGGKYSPPLWLQRIRPTLSPDIFIAEFALAGNAYHAADGFLMAAGYIG